MRNRDTQLARETRLFLGGLWLNKGEIAKGHRNFKPLQSTRIQPLRNGKVVNPSAEPSDFTGDGESLVC